MRGNTNRCVIPCLTAVRSVDSVATEGYAALLPLLFVQHDSHVEPRVAAPPRGLDSESLGFLCLLNTN